MAEVGGDDPIGTVHEQATPTDDGHPSSVAELTDYLNRMQDGNPDVVPQAVARYDAALATAHEEGGERYREVFWDYYVPLADHLDRYARDRGWPALYDIVEAYDPRNADGVALASPVVENAVGRHLIRTRHAEGIEAIPVEALDYLEAVVRTAHRDADVTFEEAHPYGWGIGHPDHSVADVLVEMARDEDRRFWAKAALEHAIYADQGTAVEVLERLVRDDDVAFTVLGPRRSTGSDRFFLDCVVGPDSDGYWPRIPRGWDCHEDMGYAFEWDPDVADRVRELVRESGVEADLPADWTFQDLAI